MALESFDDKITSLPDGETLSVLLGNGFSQAWNSSIFDYKNLLQQANFGDRDGIIRDIFNTFDTYDFEKVMRSLEAAETICHSYGIDRTKIDEINNDKEQLKTSLIDAITNTHPARSSHVTRVQYGNAKPFIKQFSKIFTLNYDLLLYWIVNKYDILPQGYFSNDGFRGITWGNISSQTVFFLHGGLHIYDDQLSIKKHTFREDIDTSIVEQVRDNLNQGKFPLFVSEPTHEKKKSRIEHNPYLNACFQALKKLDGALFIHGHSMDENDRHIFDQINDSNVNKVFVSIHGNENSRQNRETISNAQRFITKHTEFYDASSAIIW